MLNHNSSAMFYIINYFIRYSPEDCEIFWNIYLHPNINKSQWFSDENKKLKSIASKHHHQNWDAIAKELGNKRYILRFFKFNH